jgi:gamma-glutamylcyclotransferase (GGCT)/AIG2-like uncharacterized protein YtfP
MTHNIFLYSNDLDLPGVLAILNGYRLVTDPCHDSPEIIEDEGSAVYGRLVEIDDSTLPMIDTYYCVGLDIYDRVVEDVFINGGKKVEAMVYVLHREPALGV